jgi:nucleoside-diphosphate-sugar epimerase
VDELVRRGHSVSVLDNLSTSEETNLAGVHHKITFIHGSVTDRETLDRACRGVDFVVHLAALASVPLSIKDPLETNRINVDGTLQLLLAARDAGVRRVVFASSCSVYGETSTLPLREDAGLSPIAPYGLSKQMGELYGKMFHRVYGLEFVAVRYFNVFGPRQNPGSPYSGVLSLFCTAIRDGAAPIVNGDGEQSRDFIFVENVAMANILACETPGIAGMIFNIATGARTTLNQTLRLLENFSGQPANAQYGPARAGDIRHSQADISLARERMGFSPEVGFEEGLRRTWDWYRDGYCPGS